MSSPSPSAPSSKGGWPLYASAAAALGAAALLALPRLLSTSSSAQSRRAEAKNRLVRQASQSKMRMTPEERREARALLKEQRLERAFTSYCCGKREVVCQRTVGDVVVREFKGVGACRGVPIVEGFPADGSGLSSSLAANYLVTQLDLPLVGEVLSEAFPSLGVVSRYTASSGCRIYGDERLVVFVTDFQIKEEDGAASVLADLVEAIFDFADRHGSGLILTAEGLARKSSIKKSDYETQEELLMAMMQQLGDDDADEEKAEMKAALEEKMREAALEKLAEREESDASPDSASSPGDKKKGKGHKKKKKKRKKGSDDSDDSDDEPEDGEIRFVCNDADFAQRMKALGHLPLREGMLKGVTGGIIARASTASQTVVCVLSPYDEALPDASATVPIIQCFDAILGDGIAVDTTDLEREVHRIERELRKAIEEMVPKSGMTTKDRHMSMYM